MRDVVARLASLPPEKLRWRCDPARIPFETTADIEPATSDDMGQKSLRLSRQHLI